VSAQAPELFFSGDPAKGIKELRLPPLEPRALSEARVRSLKNLCDRLERFHEKRGRDWKKRDAKMEVRYYRRRDPGRRGRDHRLLHFRRLFLGSRHGQFPRGVRPYP
jgi:hypothetical protein